MSYVIQIPSQLSNHLRALRKARGMSQAELGVRLGLSQTRVARIEGRPLSVSVEQLFQVLSALGLLMTLEPLPPPPTVGADTLADATAPPIAPAAEDW